MQDDQTSLVRLETGDNDQKKRNVSGKYLRRDRSTEDYFPYFYTAGHVFATRRLTPCWSFELILVYYHFTFVSLCKLHLLYTVYARAKPLAWLKRKANFSLMQFRYQRTEDNGSFILSCKYSWRVVCMILVIA